MDNAVGVFVFDSYFDVFLGIEEKYKRWDLFEAVYRYVRFGQTKRLPTELSKIFKVLKPILDVQKKKLARNEKRRKNKKEEGSLFGESERLASIDSEDATKSCGDGDEKIVGNLLSKVEIESKKTSSCLEKNKGATPKKRGSKKDLTRDSEGTTLGQMGDEIKFDSNSIDDALALINKGIEAGDAKGEAMPIGKPNVSHNKKDNNLKSQNKSKIASSTKKGVQLDGAKKSDAANVAKPWPLEEEKKSTFCENSEVCGKDFVVLKIAQNAEGKKRGRKKKDTMVEFDVPSLSEVEEFCQKACKFVSPVQFYEYYQTKNWMAAGEKIKDWRACAIAWEQKLEQKFGGEGASETKKKDLKINDVEYSLLGSEIGGV